MSHGIIRIDMRVWDDIGRPEVTQVAKTLLLPDEYAVEQVDVRPDLVEVTVCAESIPEGCILNPFYTTTYTPDGDEMKKEPKFDHMEVYSA